MPQPTYEGTIIYGLLGKYLFKTAHILLLVTSGWSSMKTESNRGVNFAYAKYGAEWFSTA